MNPKLIISEMFYSLQGEGPSVGCPAVFLRLAACNLDCPGFSYQAPRTQEHLGCDTKLVWKKGKPYAIDDVLQEWQKLGWLGRFEQGAHLVITGGEPLLQQQKFIEFIKLLDQECKQEIYIEIETNGTIMPDHFLLQRINQFNVSPKLISSGEVREKAYRFDVLEQFAHTPQAIFKFVVQSVTDVMEIQQQYQQPLQLPSSRIWLMPEGGDRKTMESRMQVVAGLCVENNYSFSPRLHIHIWDEATGK